MEHGFLEPMLGSLACVCVYLRVVFCDERLRHRDIEPVSFVCGPSDDSSLAELGRHGHEACRKRSMAVLALVSELPVLVWPE